MSRLNPCCACCLAADEREELDHVLDHGCPYPTCDYCAPRPAPPAGSTCCGGEPIVVEVEEGIFEEVCPRCGFVLATFRAEVTPR